jgi:hypothetical protein
MPLSGGRRKKALRTAQLSREFARIVATHASSVLVGRCLNSGSATTRALNGAGISTEGSAR